MNGTENAPSGAGESLARGLAQAARGEAASRDDLLAEPEITVGDFLLARIAEDEAWARAAKFLSPSHAWIPPRFLAECEAKRVEVRFLSDLDATEMGDSILSSIAYSILCRMASVHSEHPDFNEDWRV